MSFDMVCCERAATDIDGVEAPAERARVFMAVRERAICSVRWVGGRGVVGWRGRGRRVGGERVGARGGAPAGWHALSTGARAASIDPHGPGRARRTVPAS